MKSMPLEKIIVVIPLLIVSLTILSASSQTLTKEELQAQKLKI